jgi:hypothetical protein
MLNFKVSFGSLRTLPPSRLPVLRQPAHQSALPKCHTPSPSRLPVLRRPTSGFVPWQATAQAAHGRGFAATAWRSARSQLQLKPRFSSVQQKTSRQHGEYLSQFPSWRLGFSWRPKPPLPNRLFKGTPTALASLRKCQARRPLTPALGAMHFERLARPCWLDAQTTSAK